MGQALRPRDDLQRNGCRKHALLGSSRNLGTLDRRRKGSGIGLPVHRRNGNSLANDGDEPADGMVTLIVPGSLGTAEATSES
jgi:hypothetical protein